jgi:hypothetical protein
MTHLFARISFFMTIVVALALFALVMHGYYSDGPLKNIIGELHDTGMQIKASIDAQAASNVTANQPSAISKKSGGDLKR